MDAQPEDGAIDEVDELACRQHGVVARWQLRSMGLSARAVRSRVETRMWVPLSDEVMAKAGSSAGRGRDASAGVLDTGPGALLSYRSGASWWRVPGAQLLPLHTVTTSRSSRRPELATAHIVRLVPDDLVAVLDGVRVARPELVALHLFATEPFGRAERWVERMWSMRLLDGRSIARTLSRLGERGRNGTAGLRQYLDARPW